MHAKRATPWAGGRTLRSYCAFKERTRRARQDAREACAAAPKAGDSFRLPNQGANHTGQAGCARSVRRSAEGWRLLPIAQPRSEPQGPGRMRAKRATQCAAAHEVARFVRRCLAHERSEWARQDSNLRHSPCKSDVLTAERLARCARGRGSSRKKRRAIMDLPGRVEPADGGAGLRIRSARRLRA